jgi:hypothetical protein
MYNRKSQAAMSSSPFQGIIDWSLAAEVFDEPAGSSRRNQRGGSSTDLANPLR